jgi:hypothetical protein
MSNLLELIEKSTLNEQRKNELKEAFAYYIEIAKEWENKAFSINVTDVTQLDLIKEANEGYKVLKKGLSEIEKKRKELKSQPLEEGRAIDAIAKAFTDLLTPSRDHLKEQADFAINLEKQQKEQMIQDRKNALLQYGANIDGLDIGGLPQAMYDMILNSAKIEFEAKQKREAEAKIYMDNRENKFKEILKEYENKGLMIVPIDLRTISDEMFEKYVANLDSQIEAQTRSHELQEKLDAQEKEREAQEQKVREDKAEQDRKHQEELKAQQDKLEKEAQERIRKAQEQQNAIMNKKAKDYLSKVFLGNLESVHEFLKANFPDDYQKYIDGFDKGFGFLIDNYSHKSDES